MATTAELAFEVGKLEKTFRDDVTRGANALPQLVALCRADTPDEEERAFLALKALVRCFRAAFAHQLYKLAVLPSQHRVSVLDVIAQDGEQREAAEALVDWASSQYRKSVDAIVALVAHAEAGLQVPAIQALFDMMQLEVNVRTAARAEAEVHASWIERAFAALLWHGDRRADGTVRALHPHVLGALSATLFAFVDTRTHVWKSLAALLRDAESRTPAVRASLCDAVLELARHLGPPHAAQQLVWLAPVPEKQQQPERALASQKRAFSDMWTALMASPMTKTAYKSILRSVDTELLPYLKHPIAVVDFCLMAYELGGHTALLSLQSLFAIATRLNVEVPQFYPKLYALLCGGNALFVSGYRAQLFELTDVFLSSEYLPLSYAASFAKKLCRLALEAPAYGAAVCLQLVFNVLRRHPITLSLIHRGAASSQTSSSSSSSLAAADAAEPDAKRHKWRRAQPVDRRAELQSAADEDDKDDLVLLEGEQLERSDDEGAAAALDGELDVKDEQEQQQQHDEDNNADAVVAVSEALTGDPFKADETDPGATDALSSSLWELVALQRHHSAEVSDLALLFAGDMQRPLFDIAQSASLSAKSALDKMRKKKVKHGVPLEHRLRESIVTGELASFYAAE